MWEQLGVGDALSRIGYILICFSFFIGILLTASQEAFEHFNAAMTKEHGLKKRMIPGLENNHNNLIDRTFLKYRRVTGLTISVTAFVLLLMYKI